MWSCMSPKFTAAPFIAFLLLFVPAASASHETSDGAFALGYAVDDDAVQLVFTFGGSHDAGEVLPVCQDSVPVESGSAVQGTVDGDCFQPAHASSNGGRSGTSRQAVAVWNGAVDGDANPGPVCSPIGSSILPDGGPPIVVKVNEACIRGIAKFIVGSIPLDTRFTR